MKIFDKEYFKIDNKKCVLAFGNFDGVHIGHQHMLIKAKEYAANNGLLFGIYTFADSPKFKGAYHSNLSTLQNRLSDLCEFVCPDFVYLEGFDDIRTLSPEEFVDYVIDKFGAVCTFCGDNFSFGSRALGKAADMERLMHKNGLSAKIVPTLKMNNITISSSYIKELIQNGMTETAEALLGKPYGFVSPVIHGANLGHKLGFPTINQIMPHELIVPKYGVYSTIVIVDGKEYMGVTNFGIKPTVCDDFSSPVAETYILDFSGDAYDKHVGVYFCKMLRDERKFESLDELIKNIEINVEQTRAYFKEKHGKI